MNFCVCTRRVLAILACFACTFSCLPSENVVLGPLHLISGSVNGAWMDQDGKRLVFYGDPSGKIEKADCVLFTHHRRDLVWSAQSVISTSTRTVGPLGETNYFNEPEAYWDQFQTKRFHDYAQQSTKVLTSRLVLTQPVSQGDTIDWCGYKIHVLNTPGYTRGAVSYWLDADGKRYAISGDLIYGDGKIYDLYSLQDAIPSAKIGGYHGYAGRMGDLITSLRKIQKVKPDILIPARGPVIFHPNEAIEKLITRLQTLYANYLSIDALRWYFKDDHIIAKANRVLGPERLVNWMPMAQTRPKLPSWITAISNSRLIIADDKSGFLIDCGGKNIIDQINKLKAAGKLSSIEHVFITHYHDDHTDQVSQLVNQFQCTVHASPMNFEILENPEAYRMPCLTANPIHVSGRAQSGDRWRWKEFEFVLFTFPGQTLNHDALLVKKDGEEVFFIGDSFTPSGIDDYCLLNRNLLHPHMGFFYCLDLIQKRAPHAWLINQHVEPAFRFSSEQIDRMRNTLVHRVSALRELVPWDDINYGLDEGWARFYPYACTVKSGGTTPVSLRIFNHSPQERLFKAKLHLPAGWKVISQQPDPIRVNSHEEGSILCTIQIPDNIGNGLHIITADILCDDWELHQWIECMVKTVK